MRAAVLTFALFTLACSTTRPTESVRMVPDEAQAVLSILDKRHAREAITDADWSRLFATEGYVRLKAREHSMQRKFEDDTFRAFVMSDELLARRAELSATVASWLRADITQAAQLALAYLPKGSTLKAKIYPVIKPATNSFVFDLGGDPAIFMYVEPLAREVFEATVAHELHHVGYSNNCPVNDSPQWFSAFGEGIATLAAAGGPSGIPQRKPEVMAEWTKQMAQLEENFRKVDAFLVDVASGKLSEEEQRKRGFEFFGMVGPWYTVGWKMAVVIEQTYGRDALIQASCNPREMFRLYNQAVAPWEQKTGEKLPKWSVPL
ncbi:MAG TPA: DUF5700 domain-containing putative Zn-dependent protease [Thermoanaerobaculia bacterium]|nr:DUF5700 domain-containing putative Zn-dependent protease [Thermoanaerobaculia bacterium]